MKIKFLTDLVVALTVSSSTYTFVSAILLAALVTTSESDARNTIRSNFNTSVKLTSSFATVNSLLAKQIIYHPNQQIESSTFEATAQTMLSISRTRHSLTNALLTQATTK